MSERRGSTRAKKIGDRIIQLRSEFWPEVSEDMLWSRTRHNGFISVPRALPIIQKIMDSLSVGAPLSGTYLALWCRLFDQSVVTILSPADLAFESGFSGQRSESTWIGRMRKLEELGFIKIKGTPTNPFHYVLVLNPYSVIKALIRSGVIQKDGGFYMALRTRAEAIGAKDLDDALGLSVTPGLTRREAEALKAFETVGF